MLEVENRQAVIIGINEYKDENIKGLKGAEYDAREIYERLKDPNIGNFKVSNDHYLIGKNATCERIRKAISDVFYKKESRDLALFYFSGHGFEDGYGDGYIAPYDFSRDDPFVCGINMRELKQIISRAHDTRTHNRCVIMILDCCYSGIVTEGDKPVLVSKTKYDEHIKDLSGEGIIILSSSEADEVSREMDFKHENEQESHFHGAFTVCLIEGLDGQASDENGTIYLDSLHNYVDKRLVAIGKQKSKSYEAGATGVSAIEFARSPDKYKKWKSKRIENANGYYNEGEYLFNWNEITGNRSDELIEFIKSLIQKNLIKDFDVSYVTVENIKKIDDKIINIFNRENSLSLKLNEEKMKVYLTINDVSVCKFIVKMENDKRNVYKRHISSLITAANEISKVLDNSAKDKEASHLKEKIIEDLDECGSFMESWLIAHPDVRPSILNTYSKLRKLFDRLHSKDIKEIIKFDDYAKSLFSVLHDAANGVLSPDEFIKQCKKVEQAYTHPTEHKSSFPKGGK